jgi:hypothetical protein
MTASGATIEVTAQSGGTAALDGKKHFKLRPIAGNEAVP